MNHLNLLGLSVKDKVTGFAGVVVSISFDLFGCVQAVIQPPKDASGVIPEGRWFDVSRLDYKANAKPVMAVPNFESGPVAEGLHGPANKPVPR